MRETQREPARFDVGSWVVVAGRPLRRRWRWEEGIGSVIDGRFFTAMRSHDKLSKDPRLAEELWDWTQKALEGYQ